MKNYEVQYEQSVLSESNDLRGLNLVDKDFRFVSVDTLNKVDFDSKTEWPNLERMPAEFDPKILMESSKDPGLGIRELHKEGVGVMGSKLQ